MLTLLKLYNALTVTLSVTQRYMQKLASLLTQDNILTFACVICVWILHLWYLSGLFVEQHQRIPLCVSLFVCVCGTEQGF